MKLITRDELREKLERGDEFKLVMTLSGLAYRAKRIPTSLHFETTDHGLAALDPDDEIVVYCADVYCAASIYAYRHLEREGYTRVRRYAGGVAEWEEAGYPLEAGPPGRPADRPPEDWSRARRGTIPPVARPAKSRPWRLCA